MNRDRLLAANAAQLQLDYAVEMIDRAVDALNAIAWPDGHVEEAMTREALNCAREARSYVRHAHALTAKLLEPLRRPEPIHERYDLGGEG